MEETGLKMPQNTKLLKNDASTLLTEKDKTGWTSDVSGWNGGLIFFSFELVFLLLETDKRFCIFLKRSWPQF